MSVQKITAEVLTPFLATILATLEQKLGSDVLAHNKVDHAPIPESDYSVIGPVDAVTEALLVIVQRLNRVQEGMAMVLTMGQPLPAAEGILALQLSDLFKSLAYGHLLAVHGDAIRERFPLTEGWGFGSIRDAEGVLQFVALRNPRAVALEHQHSSTLHSPAGSDRGAEELMKLLGITDGDFPPSKGPITLN